MPKYQYPSSIYDEPKTDQKIEQSHSAQSSSEEEEEDTEFFSNSDFIRLRESKSKQKSSKAAKVFEVNNKNVMPTLQLREGRAYIEGGSLYQQRTDTYNDLISELMLDDKISSDKDQSDDIEDKKIQIKSELRDAQDAFYKGNQDETQHLSGRKQVPVYADYVLSGSDESGCELDSVILQTRLRVHPIELPKIVPVFERVEIVPPKPVDSEHTIHGAKPKKKQKKYRKPRAVLLPDDEPIKQIEIIRSQPEEKIKPEKFTNKPQFTQQYQPKNTLDQVPDQITLPTQNYSNPGNTQTKNSKAKRKTKDRQQTQSVDKIQTSNSLANQKQTTGNQSSATKPALSHSRDNSAIDQSLERRGQRLKNQTSTSQLSNKSSPFKATSAFQQQNAQSKGTTTTTALSSTENQSDCNSRQTQSSGKMPVLHTVFSKKGQHNTSASQEKVQGGRGQNLTTRGRPTSGVNPLTSRQKGQDEKSNGSASNSQLRTQLTSKVASKGSAQKPVFKFKKEGADEAGSNIWALLEPTNVPQTKKVEAKAPQTEQQIPAFMEETKDQSQTQSVSKSTKKRKNKNKQKKSQQQSLDDQFNQMPLSSGQDLDYDVLQQVSNELMMGLGQQAQSFEGDRSFLAEQIVHMLQKSLQSQFGVPQPDNFDNYQRDIHQIPAILNHEESKHTDLEPSDAVVPSTANTDSSLQQPSSEASKEEDEKFHEMVSVQVKQTVRTFEWKLDSVRKEREAVIDIIESLVKEVFEPKRADRQHGLTIPIGVKQYGSQASFLAVDSSDVDLAVTGLKLGGDINTHISEMRKLFFHLEDKKSEGFIKRSEIIESASVPLIKLQVNLQVIQEINRNKSILQAQKDGIEDFKPEPLVQLDESMMILHIDITFDDYNTSVLNTRNTQGYAQDGFMPQQTSQMIQPGMMGAQGFNMMGGIDQQSYFYLRDNPQCSASPNNTTNRFTQQPNQPYMTPGLVGQSQQQRFIQNTAGQFMGFQNNNMNLAPNHNSNLMATQSCSLAISSVHKIKELQKKYTDLRNIVLIIKKMLAKHDLHKPYSGGLNSYSIVLMTSTFLEKFGINHCSALSQNLTEFLKFFGNYFDPSTHGIDGTRFFNLSPEQRQTNELIYIRDFQNMQNNTSRSAFRIYEIKKVFSAAYQQIMEKLKQFKTQQDITTRMRINVINQLID